MGIRNKNLQQKTYQLRSPGTLTAAVAKDSIMILFPGYISNIVASVTSGGSGATSSIVDLNLNDVTVFGAATKMTFVATTGVVSYSALATQPTPVVAGDILSIDVDSIATTPKGLNVAVTVTRTGIVAETNVVNHDNVL